MDNLGSIFFLKFIPVPSYFNEFAAGSIFAAGRRLIEADT